MNAERMINMVIRMFMRRGINMAMDSGLKAMNRRGQGNASVDGADEDTGMSREDKQRMRAQKQAIRKARRASRMASKIGKF